jgi:hypothetical protein
MFTRPAVPGSSRPTYLRSIHIALVLVTAFAFLIVFPGDSLGQTFRGTIIGTVLDPNGAVVPAVGSGSV